MFKLVLALVTVGHKNRVAFRLCEIQILSRIPRFHFFLLFSVATPPRVQTNMPTESDVPKDPTRVRVDVPGSTNTLFLDVGALAPRNAYCALCDTHEYLHRVDLPAYLISPCYHCREWLAREAKISPEILLDLHLRVSAHSYQTLIVFTTACRLLLLLFRSCND